MSAMPGMRAQPSIALHWVRNSILSAIAADLAWMAFASISAGGVPKDAGLAHLVLLMLTVVGLMAIAGVAHGLLSAAVLRRIVPSLPVRTWIALHCVMAFAHSNPVTFTPSGDPETYELLATFAHMGMPILLSVIFLMGVIFSGVFGGLEALVLRRAAVGSAMWIVWSTVASTIGMLLVVGGSILLDLGSDLAGIVASQFLALLAAVVMSLVMLPAVRRLKSRLLSGAAQHFT
jgi:hypothetical protein